MTALVGVEPHHLRTHLLISASHLTKETAEVLDGGAEDLGSVVVSSFDGGWFVSADEAIMQFDEIPADLARIIDLGHRNGCLWIILDDGAPLVGGLDSYTW